MVIGILSYFDVDKCYRVEKEAYKSNNHIIISFYSFGCVVIAMQGKKKSTKLSHKLI